MAFPFAPISFYPGNLLLQGLILFLISLSSQIQASQARGQQHHGSRLWNCRVSGRNLKGKPVIEKMAIRIEAKGEVAAIGYVSSQNIQLRRVQIKHKVSRRSG